MTWGSHRHLQCILTEKFNWSLIEPLSLTTSLWKIQGTEEHKHKNHTISFFFYFNVANIYLKFIQLLHYCQALYYDVFPKDYWGILGILMPHSMYSGCLQCFCSFASFLYFNLLSRTSACTIFGCLVISPSLLHPSPSPQVLSISLWIEKPDINFHRKYKGSKWKLNKGSISKYTNIHDRTLATIIEFYRVFSFFFS